MATKEPAIGIDLGTTNSCVAVYQNGKVDIIANDQGNRTTPSCVAFTDTELLVGEAARSQVAMNHRNTIYDVKRLIGRQFKEDEVQADMQHWPFEVVDNNSYPNIKVMYKGSEKIFCPQEISAMVLTKMREIAEAYLGMPVKDAVITVPAYFNDSQRLATKDAGTIAGLNVLQIINEPTAAAIAYGMEKEKLGLRKVLIYDLGGGTFDVTILTIDDGVFKVLSTGGDTHLGGEDFDSQIVNHFVEDFRKKHNKDLTTNKKALRRLRTACERAKRDLSSTTRTSIDIDSLYEGIDYQTTITRAKLDELNVKLFRSTLEPITQCLKDANMDKAEVDEVVVVGGSTRILKIQKLLQEFFNDKEPNRSLNPDEAVAYGAAVQAAVLTGNDSANFILIDVAPLSLGIEVKGGIVSTIIKRNTPIPTEQTEQFITTFDNQTSVEICVYEGELGLTKCNRLLGKFSLINLPPKPQGEVEIYVTFKMDANGILIVSAEEDETQQNKSITISNERGRLSKRVIKRMIDEAEKFREEGETIKNAITAKNKLQDYCYTVKTKLMETEHGLFESDHATILSMCNVTIDWVDSDQMFKKEEYEKRLEDLEAEFRRCSVGVNSGSLPD